MSLWQRNVLLAILALALVAVPLLFVQGAEWGATDSANTEAIQEVQPEYEPWFEPFFSAGDLGIERQMFGLQALLGSLALSAGLGWLVGRYRARQGGGEGDRRTATIVCALGIVVAVILFFVETEFGELQAFITAVQGVLVGFLGFFVGYPLGRRQVEAGGGDGRASVPPARGTPA